MDGFVGEIRLMPLKFTPLYWVPCDGRSLSIQAYPALAAVIGTLYGGDGRTTFNVPNLGGRVAVGAGDNPTDLFRPLVAATGGASAVMLTFAQMPAHTHVLSGATVAQTARVASPEGNYLAPVAYVPASGSVENAKGFAPSVAQPTTVPLHPGTLSPFPGAGGAHESRQPYLALQYFICTEGEFPMRN